MTWLTLRLLLFKMFTSFWGLPILDMEGSKEWFLSHFVKSVPLWMLYLMLSPPLLMEYWQIQVFICFYPWDTLSHSETFVFKAYLEDQTTDVYVLKYRKQDFRHNIDTQAVLFVFVKLVSFSSCLDLKSSWFLLPS